MLNINNKEYESIVKDIIENKEFIKLKKIKHHGISRYEHLVNISYRAYVMAKKRKLDYKSVARGGILHDFYLDGNERSKLRRFLDTFTHPKKALITCRKIFQLNKLEENIIISHMFPFYPAIPKYRESFLVGFVDKIWGLKEMIACLFRIFKHN